MRSQGCCQARSVSSLPLRPARVHAMLGCPIREKTRAHQQDDCEQEARPHESPHRRGQALKHVLCILRYEATSISQGEHSRQQEQKPRRKLTPRRCSIRGDNRELDGERKHGEHETSEKQAKLGDAVEHPLITKALPSHQVLLTLSLHVSSLSLLGRAGSRCRRRRRSCGSTLGVFDKKRNETPPERRQNMSHV